MQTMTYRLSKLDSRELKKVKNYNEASVKSKELSVAFHGW